MSDLKGALSSRDVAAVWSQSQDVSQIARAARGSKKRLATAVMVFALHESKAGDAQIARWMKQKAMESVLSGLSRVAQDHRCVDRFCTLLGERLLAGLRFNNWSNCVEALLWMRRPEALGYVMTAAEQSAHGSPGTLNRLARGGDIRHEAARIRQMLTRFGSDAHILDHATRLWIRAKLGEDAAHQALVTLCLTGPIHDGHAQRAAQALSNIHGWRLPFGAKGTAQAQEKLKAGVPELSAALGVGLLEADR